MEQVELPDDVHAAILRLCEEGGQLANEGDDQGALSKYREAWNLIPEDKENWDASTWILTAAGDVHFRRDRFKDALESFLQALKGPNGVGNPYIHLRIGEIQLELGNLKAAGDNLARAYMGAGEDIFVNEDPKYFEFIRSILKPPAGKESW